MLKQAKIRSVCYNGVHGQCSRFREVALLTEHHTGTQPGQVLLPSQCSVQQPSHHPLVAHLILSMMARILQVTMLLLNL